MKTIELTQGKYALVDDEDFTSLSMHKWQAQKSGRRFYATRRGPRPGCCYIPMHRIICSVLPGERVDHINGDGLDNRRANLRRATRQENARGFCLKKVGATSRFRGVSWHAGRKKWIAEISLGSGVGKHLGLFDDEVEAAAAYDTAARLRFGQFASLNFSLETSDLTIVI